MEKLKLEIDSLSVESFDAAPAMKDAGGTVAAHEVTTTCQTWPPLQCSHLPTCGIAC